MITVLLENLTVTQPVRHSPPFMKLAGKLFLTWARRIHSVMSHLISLRSVLMFYSLRLRSPFQVY